MILSSPFSRQHRNHHQSWQLTANSNGASRKPPPEQPAPKPTVKQQSNYRSQTLNRVKDLQNRTTTNHQLAIDNRSLQRNHSALGNYANRTEYLQTNNNNISLKRSNVTNAIYAPASIASPNELAHYKRPITMDNRSGESQHYAATSCRGAYSTASESGKSGRESALGNLWNKFGSLRRSSKSKWRSRSGGGRGVVNRDEQQTINGQQPPPTLQNPEIYATGKKKVEAEEIDAEGLHAIDSNIMKRLLEHEINLINLNEGETRTLICEEDKCLPDYQELVNKLINWINDELSQERIIISDLQEDLYDGQVLGNLIERLYKLKLDLVEVTQNESAQRYKLRTVLDTISRILTNQAKWAQIRWSVDGIHGKNMVEIIHLLVTLAVYFRAPIKLPPNVSVRVIIIQKHQNQLLKRYQEAQLTQSAGSPGFQGPAVKLEQQKRDAFDTLFEFRPDKLDIVKLSLVKFVNRHLNKINMSCFANPINEVLDPEQFSDGLLLVFLIASLEDYFIPLGNLFTSSILNTQQSFTPQRLSDLNEINNISQTALEPTSYINTQPIQKLHNVNFALQLIEDAGISIKETVRAEDIVNGDLKTILRVLYALFSRYKHL